ncbi:Uncharacterised protein [Mycobacteroides abscessus subsp. abscessus]|nr:Uncharacterised protein [Mycobacteroides abscessus subsp. abscessus]
MVLRLDDHIVVQRPQGGVGEALVVFGDFLGGKPDRVQHHVVFGNRLDIRIGHARPADPGTTALAQQRLHRGDQPARTAFPRCGTVGQFYQVDGKPIGDHNEVGGAGDRLYRRSLIRLGRHDCFLRGKRIELRVDLGWPDTQHREQHAALVGIVRVRGDDALSLMGSLVRQRLEVVDRGWVGLGWHSPILGDAM